MPFWSYLIVSCMDGKSATIKKFGSFVRIEAFSMKKRSITQPQSKTLFEASLDKTPSYRSLTHAPKRLDDISGQDHLLATIAPFADSWIRALFLRWSSGVLPAAKDDHCQSHCSMYTVVYDTECCHFGVGDLKKAAKEARN